MLIKAGVDISRLRPEIRKALNAIAEIYEKNDEELIITSTYEGTHSPGSKHYANDAVDIRTPAEPWIEVVSQLDDILGHNFFVLDEGSHIHIHFIRI